MSKAFDTIAHTILINKLTFYGIHALSYTNYWSKHWSAEVQGAAVTCYIPTGRRHDEGDTLLCSKFRLQIKKNWTKPLQFVPIFYL